VGGGLSVIQGLGLAGWLAVGVWFGYGWGMKKGMDTTWFGLLLFLLLVYIHGACGTMTVVDDREL
jgi:hypothetical protein